MASDIDWNQIKLSEIYETYDAALRLLDEDFERVRRLIDTAIQHGATPERMTEPLEIFAYELYSFCNAIEDSTGQKQYKTQTS